MDNELFELCREVFEKTGLEGDGDTNYEMQYGIAHYTSDYLLEKLPHTVAAIKGGSNCEAYIIQVGKIKAKREYADTPLKALLKLTLALHEAGELK